MKKKAQILLLLVAVFCGNYAMAQEYSLTVRAIGACSEHFKRYSQDTNSIKQRKQKFPLRRTNCSFRVTVKDNQSLPVKDIPVHLNSGEPGISLRPCFPFVLKTKITNEKGQAIFKIRWPGPKVFGKDIDAYLFAMDVPSPGFYYTALIYGDLGPDLCSSELGD